MEGVVKLVAEKAGITESQVRIAVNPVANVLKDRMPEGMANQVDTYLKGSGSSGDLAMQPENFEECLERNKKGHLKNLIS